MKDWFDSAAFVEGASVEVGFLLHPDFYYGPDGHIDIAERKLVEPICLPTFARQQERLVTTKPVQNIAVRERPQLWSEPGVGFSL